VDFNKDQLQARDGILRAYDDSFHVQGHMVPLWMREGYYCVHLFLPFENKVQEERLLT